MERKIGEIFEYNGEWYQCIRSSDCPKCDLKIIKDCRLKFPCESLQREDCEEVIFKKLEKVGEPYMLEDKKFQKYRVFKPPYIYHKIDCSWQSFSDPYYISLEVKQNKKEDMEIYRVVMNIDDKDYLLDRLDAILHDTHCQQYKDEVCEALSKYMVSETTFDLKPFDLDAAKAGKPVCTRNGRKARIICFDAEGEHPIIALVTDGVQESPYNYTKEGYYHTEGVETMADLMMLPEKKEGWVNVYKDSVYDTYDEALIGRSESKGYIDTIKVEWEE